MSDVFADLRHDHERIDKLLDELRGDPAGPEPSPHERKKIAEELVVAESRHEALEEAYFWPVVRDRAPQGGALALRAIEQEQTGKKLLNELEKTSPGTVEFGTLVFQVISNIRQHVTYEELQVWPRLRLRLTDAEGDELGSEISGARPLAPTRPHPLTPPDATVLRTVGPAVGLLDRVRDVLTARG
ncbi:MAG TPA: hemerythrin domain-containing protein [Acidimicrobiales bacterium]|nr:hemerythrin domain-containing protein [Acidimicrobiales bacterium]